MANNWDKDLDPTLRQYRHSDRHRSRYLQSPFLGRDQYNYPNYVDPIGRRGNPYAPRPQNIVKRMLPLGAIGKMDRPMLTSGKSKFINQAGYSHPVVNSQPEYFNHSYTILDKTFTKKNNR